MNKKIPIQIMIVLLAALLNLFVLAPLKTSYSVAYAEAQAEDIQNALDGFLIGNQDNNAGVATAVFGESEDLYVKYFGYANKTRNIMVDENTVIEWGSVSKLTIWVSVMQLVERGKIDLDADIKTYLPSGFLRTLRYTDKITMLNLMNHNAGFQETLFDYETTDESAIIGLKEFLYQNQPIQVWRPSDVVGYSNWSSALAGFIVECVAQKSFYEYVQENIFAPLGMTKSAIAPDLSDNLYVKEKRNELEYFSRTGYVLDMEKSFIQIYPAGMAVSTLNDLKTFAKALLAKDARLMKEQTFDMMFSPSLYYTNTTNPRNCHGFWVDYDFGSSIIGHSGNTSGCSSRVILDFENKLGMVVLTNQSGGSLYRTKMPSLVFGSYGGESISFEGYVQPSRDIVRGPALLLLKFFDHAGLNDEMLKGLYANKTADRIEYNSADYLFESNIVDFFDVFTLICIILIVLTAVYLVLKLVFKNKKFFLENKLDKLNTLHSAIITGSIALFVLGFVFEGLVSYVAFLKVLSFIVFVYGLCLFAMIAISTAKMVKEKQKLQQNLASILLIVVSIIMLLTIGYWDLYAFWLV